MNPKIYNLKTIYSMFFFSINMLTVIKTRDIFMVYYVLSVNTRFTPVPHMFTYMVIHFNDAVVHFPG